MDMPPELTREELLAKLATARRKVAELEAALAGAKADAADRTGRSVGDMPEYFRQFAENLEQVFYLNTLDGVNQLYVNPAYETVFGRPLDELRNDPWAWTRSIHPADLGTVMNHIERCKTGDFSPVEYRILLPGGAVRWLREQTVPLRDEAGRVTHIAGLVRDVSGERLSETAIRQSEERFRALLERLESVAVQGYAMDGSVIYWNQTSEQVYGYSATEAMGRNLVDLIIPPAMRDDVRAAIRFMSETGQPIPASELLLMRKDGSLVPVFSSHALVCIPGREPELFCMDVDLTRMKNVEEELRAARILAEEASRSKSRFLANMSHEIRTPLSGMLGMLQLLAVGDLAPEQQDFANMALRAGDRLTRLLGDILDLSRIEAGRLPICEEPFALRALLKEVGESFAPLSREKGVPLHIEEHGELGELPAIFKGDPMRLRQILFNFVGNAMKFTQRGEVRLDVSRLPWSRRGEARLLFAVSDTGPGIPDEEQREVFTRFSQGSSRQSRPGEGAGLGLTIAQGLAGLMGGSIALESHPGRGTSLYLSLPLRLTDDTGDAAEDPQAADAKPLPGLRVLLAEDDRLGSLFVQRTLERMGCSTRLVCSGREVLEALLTQDFDCVLMDVQMPEMDGIEATRIIRTDQRFSCVASIPIIAVTAHAMAGDRERLLAAGMDAYISKPVQTEELRRAVAALRQRAGPEAGC